MTKADRQKIFEKYGGKCAYTGKPLPQDWQVDHVTPKASAHWLLMMTKGEPYNMHNEGNLVPTFRILNHYKRNKDLEAWRQYLLSFHIRISKLPKKTRVEKRKKYVAYMKEVAEYFGITEEAPFNGIFYFETIQQQSNGNNN